jgi:xanthine dehydrogenase accessory factor
MREIAESLQHVIAAGCDAILVTIVNNSGSAPRHVGSQMLVSSAGLICGTVGGGAIEGHAIATARAMVGAHACRVENLALKKNLGMACGGAAVLLYMPVNSHDKKWGSFAAQLVRCINGRIHSRMLLTCVDGAPANGCGAALVDTGGTLLAGSQAVAESAFTSDAKPETIRNLGQGLVVGDCFEMPVAVPPRAVVFGGGHVGVAVIEALSRVGFACTLFECRPEFALAQRVPAAREIIVGDYENIAASIKLEPDDYVLIMTHTHRFDGAVLEQAVRTPLAYAGCIGSRGKIAGVRKRLQQAGVPDEVIDSVHMPIGLDIKAETPEEIAVSITAECILHRASRSNA